MTTKPLPVRAMPNAPRSGGRPLRRLDEPTRKVSELDRLSFEELRQVWEAEGFGSPPRLRRRLLAGLLAYQLQVRGIGGLPADTARRLRAIAGETGRRPNTGAAVETRIKPGTRMLRVWRGQLHEVTALDRGFAYRGNSYASLSVIARLITGTRWSGPQFFGLKGNPVPIGVGADRGG